jgi:hypothetical protein
MIAPYRDTVSKVLRRITVKYVTATRFFSELMNRVQFSWQHLKEHSKMKLISKVVLAALSGALVAAAAAQALAMLAAH